MGEADLDVVEQRNVSTRVASAGNTSTNFESWRVRSGMEDTLKVSVDETPVECKYTKILRGIARGKGYAPCLVVEEQRRANLEVERGCKGLELKCYSAHRQSKDRQWKPCADLGRVGSTCGRATADRQRDILLPMRAVAQARAQEIPVWGSRIG
ncbi:hypothetical protein DFH09DRAFT_1167679 [Mycena vulgaris]|nr:hypothetical protein DFH09DRAFT_1167679 [Mycena vulgaris]